MPRQPMKFYCFATKSSFTTKEYGKRIQRKNGRVYYMAVANHKGNTCVRLLSKEQYERLK